MICALSDRACAESFRAILNYFETLEVPDFENEAAAATFAAIKEDIDESLANFAAVSEKNRKNVLKRWATEEKHDTSVYERIRANTNYTEAEAEAEERSRREKAEAEAAPAPSLNDIKKICEKEHIKLNSSDLEEISAELAGHCWTFGGEPIRNISKVLRWYERNIEEIRKDRKHQKRSLSFSNQRVYDYDELEKQLLSIHEGHEYDD